VVYDNSVLKKMFIYNKNIYKERGIIMKQSTVKVLDEKDLEIIEALRSVDVPRNAATLITFLANVSEANSREIEMATDLRQPEVSIAMRTLRNNHWVEEREVKTEGKGRPMKIYTLSVPIEEIIKHYENMKNSETARTMQAIQRLKEITAT
jgi:predicted transcriptional regulator